MDASRTGPNSTSVEVSNIALLATPAGVTGRRECFCNAHRVGWLSLAPFAVTVQSQRFPVLPFRYPLKSRSPELPRSISRLGATAIVIGSMLGVGIFLAPAVMLQQGLSPRAYMFYWLVGGLTALAGALSFAELGAMMPRSGGEYAFLRRAMGPSVAVATGWTLVLVVFPGSIAAMCVAVAEYQFIPWIEAFLGHAVTSPRALSNGLALTLTLFFTLLNIKGAQLSARAQTVLTVFPLVTLCLVAVAGLAFAPAAPHIDLSAVTAPDLPTQHRIHVFAVAFMATYFAFSGWNAVAYVAGEVEEPARNVPRALFIGTLIVTGLYLLLAYFFLHTLGPHHLAQSPEAGSAAVSAWLGGTSGWWMSVPIALGVLASINGTVLGGARISFALAQDRLLPHFLASTSRREGAPHAALWMQALVTAILILSGTFELLLQLTSLTMLVIGSTSVAGLIVLRVTEPETERPFRVPFYPFTPLVYLAGSLFVVGVQCWVAASSILRQDGEHRQQSFVLLGFAAFGLIIVAHRLWHRLRSTNASSGRSR